MKWQRLRRQNHWFDAIYNACAAGHYCGVRLVADGKKPRTRTKEELLAEIASRPTVQEMMQRSRR